MCLPRGDEQVPSGLRERSASRTKRRNTGGPRRDSSAVLMSVAVERRERQAANVKSDWSDCHQKIYLFFFFPSAAAWAERERTGHSGNGGRV